MTESSTAPAANDDVPVNVGNAGPAGADRDALIALVEKTQGETTSADDAAKEKAVRDGVVAKPEEPKNPDEPPMSKIARELKAREKEKGILARAQEREAASQAAYAEAQQIVQQAKQFAAQVAGEFERLKRLKDDPVAVINEFGWDPNAIIEAGVNHKDPAYQAKVAERRAWEEQHGKLAQENRALAERLEKIEKVAKTYEEQGANQAKIAAEKQLIASIPEASPARQLLDAGLWTEKYILEMAYDVDRQIRAKTRKAPSLSELAEYLHFVASEKIRGLKPQESAGRSNAGKSKANGSRALSNRDASERRGAQATKSFDEMTPEEQRAHLIATVEEARRVG